MFDFFKSRQEHVEELMDKIKESADSVTSTVPLQTQQAESYYRVGYDCKENMTTITLGAVGGWTSTLSLSEDECERLIRLIRASYQVVEQPNE